MAKLRSATGAQTARPKAPELPEKLAAWYVDDWVTDDENVHTRWRSGGWETKETRDAMGRILLSRRRFRAARDEWAADLRDRGVRPPPMEPPGNPRRRNPVSGGRRR